MLVVLLDTDQVSSDGQRPHSTDRGTGPNMPRHYKTLRTRELVCLCRLTGDWRPETDRAANKRAPPSNASRIFFLCFLGLFTEPWEQPGHHVKLTSRLLSSCCFGGSGRSVGQSVTNLEVVGLLPLQSRRNGWPHAESAVEAWSVVVGRVGRSPAPSLLQSPVSGPQSPADGRCKSCDKKHKNPNLSAKRPRGQGAKVRQAIQQTRSSCGMRNCEPALETPERGRIRHTSAQQPISVAKSRPPPPHARPPHGDLPFWKYRG